ncbi:MAG: DUF4157 domain-containing protein [Myxococcota bacterium]
MNGPQRAAQARANHGASVTPVPPGQLRTIGEGRPLEPEIQQHMERFFETDFSGVRVHEGPAASAMGALAFTLGEQLHFAPGLYDPASREGIELLGHELAHVVQQREGRVGNPYGQGVAIVQDPQLEAEADHMGRLVAQEIWSQAPVRATARRNGARIMQSKRRAPGIQPTQPGSRPSPLGPRAPMKRPGPLPRTGDRVSDAAVQRATAHVAANKRCTIDGLTGTGNDFKPMDNGWEQLSATQIETFCDEDTDYPLWHVGATTIDHPCAYHGTWAFGGRTVVFFRYSPTKQDRKNESWVGPNAHKAPRSQLLIKYQRLTQQQLTPTVWRRSAHNEIAIDFCLETSNATPKKKTRCFLSSACVQAHGLPDDCFELTTLRRFRDGYLQSLPTGPATIEQYNDLAPRILDGIDRCPDADARLEALYDELVAPCVRLIVSEQPHAALELYEAQVRALEHRYLRDDDTES